jgi:hypothetical protein
MRFILEVSDPKVMEYIFRHATRLDGQWEDSVRELILAGGQFLYPEPVPATHKVKKQSKRK